ncbi:Diaminopimelate decarboxylase [Gemmata obscuriglobus]|uniref:Diaminopimelate decarboxylase n=1 Tax=Gemmata obscuriglobus TaxID=114 RepID=A0A2Z3GXY3_9BACT|nr:diaminopimelate decarboxylase [Gemmata obscuriglobus]AWM37501.1 diaminopimelate decarboxylase [Gemmata obscuriglobus]QEG29729.1 Diaminopimelate decarboxylase [Gemmata obscuriglobus]VTS09046.1 diaminopimelate decarboxylase : Diaminopimelate decarboxylase OS=Planctomyces limnophilus (strain ATCC 43296 / DSM 3776 / IFAM 1008 / 290) GN=lysA PE=3 SV=1: Orn_Arg_deC_N: Orn_DAP_Arg_deC [Gemmata obscuriglobus UQM 2246]
MDHFDYRDRTLFCEDVPVPELAEKYGTPLYVYSEAALVANLNEVQTAFRDANPVICYSVKANGNLSICRLMGQHGSGFDVTSQGEFQRALKAGPAAAKVVFAGVGKTDSEIEFALKNGVFLFDVESEQELHAIGAVAQKLGVKADVALRVNPDLPPKTHVKTDTSVKGVKFGLDIETIVDVAKGVVGHPGLSVVGLHMHLGSPILKADPYRMGAEKGLGLIKQFRAQGHDIKYLNMGGGFGINYRKDEAKPASAFADVILPVVKESGCQLILEPGRFIVGNAAVLLSRVVFTKSTGGKHYVIQDAAMNDLIRPTLYGSFHRIWPVAPAAGVPVTPDVNGDPDDPQPFREMPNCFKQDVVGPVCESGDYLAKDRPLPGLTRGDLLAVFSAGAYGMTMSSNYNSRCRAAEVLVSGRTHRLIRRRETFADLVACEEDCLT